ncbi:MAG: hypothetical protein ACOCXH_12355 [Cyclobacteriaceae bacterium]
MKNKILLYFLGFATMLYFSQCGGSDPGPAFPMQEELDKLKNITWQVDAVSKNGSITNEFDDFTIQFRGTPDGENFQGTYSTTNGQDLWNTSGTWTFSDSSPLNTLMFDEELSVNYLNSGNRLRLSFIKNPPDGRLLRLEGDWVFDLVPQN